MKDYKPKPPQQYLDPDGCPGKTDARMKRLRVRTTPAEQIPVLRAPPILLVDTSKPSIIARFYRKDRADFFVEAYQLLVELANFDNYSHWQNTREDWVQLHHQIEHRARELIQKLEGKT